jgi:hypothetical protein
MQFIHSLLHHTHHTPDTTDATNHGFPRQLYTVAKMVSPLPSQLTPTQIRSCTLGTTRTKPPTIPSKNRLELVSDRRSHFVPFPFARSLASSTHCPPRLVLVLPNPSRLSHSPILFTYIHIRFFIPQQHPTVRYVTIFPSRRLTNSP